MWYAINNARKNPRNVKEIEKTKPNVLPPNILPSAKPPNKPSMVKQEIKIAYGRA